MALWNSSFSVEWSAGLTEGYGLILPRWLKIVGVPALVAISLVILLREFPIGWLLPKDRFTISYLEPVTLGKGRIWLAYPAPGVDFTGTGVDPSGLPEPRSALPEITGLIEVRWHWCPERDFFSWCVQVENSMGKLAGMVSPLRDGFSASQIVGEFALVPALLPGDWPATARVLLDLARLRVTDSLCPMHGEAEVEGDVQLIDLEIMSYSLGDHHLVLGSAVPGHIDLEIRGDRAVGDLDIDGGEVTGSVVLRPPESLAELVAAFALPQGDGSFRATLKGQAPCFSGAQRQ